ncbi:hypothetical protein BCR33DRAFT_344633 [Rhizoclosmatium globosum]|uniref:Uncharacterized protein n=1 Tax=Rhizoclosmatium globosum TaxID=329046 RepID=A0A1Y2C369_9FUNG|nr:hypothetical protein BCR33DRAFT_344633 [Rhizoclosmatium globosum]|eukprot:ORY41337.1 hypothetical protein BCR33DRAFT_344633 [Rhizoclosmatium globosum]
MDTNELFYTLSWAVPSFLSAAGVGMIAFLFSLITTKDLPQKKLPPTLSNIFSPSNRSMLGLFFFGVVIYMAAIAYYNYTHEVSKWAFIVAWTAMASANTCNS